MRKRVTYFPYQLPHMFSEWEGSNSREINKYLFIKININ